MKTTLYLLIIILSLNCKSSTEKINKSCTPYQDWKLSVQKTINNNSYLRAYEKSNLLSLVNSVTENNFLEFKNILNIVDTDCDKIDEYFVFSYSEGEIVTSFLYYVVKIDKNYLIASLELNGKKGIIKKIDEERNYIINKLSLIPFSEENESQEIVILSSQLNGKLKTKIGNAPK